MSVGPGLSRAPVCQDHPQGRAGRVSDRVKSPPSPRVQVVGSQIAPPHTRPAGLPPQGLLPAAETGIEIPVHLAPDVGGRQAGSSHPGRPPLSWDRKPGAGLLRRPWGCKQSEHSAGEAGVKP